MFERFDDGARSALVLAQDEADQLDDDHIGVEHLLLGMLHPQGDRVCIALHDAGLTLSRTRDEILNAPHHNVDPSVSGGGRFTAEARDAFDSAALLSLREGDEVIGQRHLLSALLAPPSYTAADILDALGVDREALASDVG